jgi:hypothetical protein
MDSDISQPVTYVALLVWLNSVVLHILSAEGFLLHMEHIENTI